MAFVQGFSKEHQQGCEALGQDLVQGCYQQKYGTPLKTYGAVPMGLQQVENPRNLRKAGKQACW